MMTSYRDQYRDPRWQKKRLEALEAAGWGCQNCGDTETTLNVHHKQYVKGRAVWDYGLDDLVVLCEPCHQFEHEWRDMLQRFIDEAGEGALMEAVTLVAGYFSGYGRADPGSAEMARQLSSRTYEIGVAAAALDISVAWRKCVIDFAAQQRPFVSRTILGLIDQWKDEEKDRSETNGRA